MFLDGALFSFGRCFRKPQSLGHRLCFDLLLLQLVQLGSHLCHHVLGVLTRNALKIRNVRLQLLDLGPLVRLLLVHIHAHFLDRRSCPDRRIVLLELLLLLLKQGDFCCQCLVAGLFIPARLVHLLLRERDLARGVHRDVRLVAAAFVDAALEALSAKSEVPVGGTVWPGA